MRRHRAPGTGQVTAEGASSGLARITLTADAPLRWHLEEGPESPRYSAIGPIPVLVVGIQAPVSTIVTRVALLE